LTRGGVTSLPGRLRAGPGLEAARLAADVHALWLVNSNTSAPENEELAA
jgi:hypothetical protein